MALAASQNEAISSVDFANVKRIIQVKITLDCTFSLEALAQSDILATKSGMMECGKWFMTRLGIVPERWR
jgi:hypothetical protein